MRFTRFLTKEDKKKLEFEVIPQDLIVYITRLLQEKIGERGEDTSPIVWQNMLVNMSHNLLEMPVYVLRADDWGLYPVYEQIWHEGEMNLVFRRLNTFQFIELLCELIERNWFTGDELNPLFEQANLSFRILDVEETAHGFSKLDKPQVYVFPIQGIEDQADEDEHPNIRLLVHRMDLLLGNNDPSGVLHTSATIFETLAKDIIASPSIENKSLGSFFDKFLNNSRLPEPILDYIQKIYNDRNTRPLAGHGQTKAPNVTKAEAITIAEMTKALVKIEYQLRREALQVKRSDENA